MLGGLGRTGGILEVAVPEQQVEELSLGVAGISEWSQCLPALPVQAQTHATNHTQLLCLEAHGMHPRHLPSQGRGGQV